MRKVLLTRAATPVVLAAFIAAAVASAYAFTAREQRDGALREAEAAQWEYAVIGSVTEMGRGATPRDIKFRGVAALCYARENGCQQFQVEGSDRAEALARAMAKLGQEGWEMVGESPFPVGVGSTGGLYFKRRKK